VINTNWHPISYHFEVIADYCSNSGHFAFLSPLWGGDLGGTYTVHFRLIGKLVVNFLFVLIELFSLGVTAERIFVFYLFFEGGSFGQMFTLSETSPANHFCTVRYASECLTIVANSIYTQNFVADFLQVKYNFIRKIAVQRF